MKKFLLIALLFLFFPISHVSAQFVSQNLATVQYKTPEDLTVLFQNSARVLTFLEGEDIPQPVFLGIFTNEQIFSLKEKGFVVNTIDSNADLTHYALLWHPEAGRSATLQQYGEVFVITPNHTLLKTPQPYYDQGTTEQFLRIPFTSEPIATPLPREQLKTLPSTPPNNSNEKNQVVKESKTDTLLLPIIIGFIVLFTVGVGGFILLKRKKPLSV